MLTGVKTAYTRMRPDVEGVAGLGAGVGQRWKRRSYAATGAGLVIVAVLSLFFTLRQVPPPAALHGYILGPGEAAEVTRFVGGEPGHRVFENIWWHQGRFHVFLEDPDTFLPIESVITEADYVGLTVHHISDGFPPGQQANSRWLAGTTVLITSIHLYEWFYHFAVDFVQGAFATLARVSPLDHPETAHTVPLPVPDRLIVPFREHWRDGWGMTEMYTRAIFGDNFISYFHWQQLVSSRYGDPWIGFERVVIEDNDASHFGDTANSIWGKIALNALHAAPSPYYYRTIRQTLLRRLGIRDPGARPALGRALDHVPKVVYIDRQNTNRRLVDDDHRRLVHLLEEFAGAEKAHVVHARWDRIEPEDQVEITSDADILLGVHGQGLTHELFMLFPKFVFSRHYEPLSVSLGHQHHVIWEDHEVPHVEWEARSGIEAPVHDGHTETPLDTDFFRHFLDDLLASMAGRA
ncbi:hypothetical protein Q5752_000392 [Cryptotrichosporon argae]